MNVKEVTDSLSIAAWEMAEAAQHDREAARLRKDAAQRIAIVHANLRIAEREAMARRIENEVKAGR